jgi:XisI protein
VRALVAELLTHRPSYGSIDTQAMIDLAGDHYMVMHVGWHRGRRVHGCVLHIDIIDDKIWIQHDGTTDGVAQTLVAAGVPQEAIVLGFQPPERRQLTAFASA